MPVTNSRQPKAPLDPKRFRLADYVGEDLAITPVELRTGIKCKKGTPDEYKADAMKATVTVLTGKDAGRTATDTLLFGKAVVSTLTRALEDFDLPLACTVEWRESENGTNEDGTPWTYLAIEF